MQSPTNYGSSVWLPAVTSRVWLSCTATRAARPFTPASQKIIAGVGLKAQDAAAHPSFGQSPQLAVGYGQLSDVALNSATLPQTLRPPASTQLRIELRLPSSFLSIDVSHLITHPHSHHAQHIPHRAAPGSEQKVHRQGRRSRCFRMVERAAGTSRESIAPLMKPELC